MTIAVLPWRSPFPALVQRLTAVETHLCQVLGVSPTLCAWCHKTLGYARTDRVSHGICTECHRKFFPED